MKNGWNRFTLTEKIKIEIHWRIDILEILLIKLRILKKA